MIQPDGDLTLNYLDTQGAPLTNLQITTTAALVAKMAGHPADEDRRSLRLALEDRAEYQIIDGSPAP